MEKKVILSTALMPNIDYISTIASSDVIEIEAFETYKKQTYRNRYEIAGPNGRQALSVPVNKNGMTNCPVGEVRVSYDNNWLKNHIKSIETAYNSSPFFLYYKDEFFDIFKKKHEFLFEMNKEFLQLILKILEIDKQIHFTTEFKKTYEPEILDLREKISPKKPRLHKTYTPYYQVFMEKNGFIEDLSVLDLIFNMGPESRDFLIFE